MKELLGTLASLVLQGQMASLVLRGLLVHQALKVSGIINISSRYRLIDYLFQVPQGRMESLG